MDFGPDCKNEWGLSRPWALFPRVSAPPPKVRKQNITSSDRFDGSSRCGFVYQAITSDHLQWLKWLPLDPIRIISTKTSRTRAPHRVGTLQVELSTLITVHLAETVQKRSNQNPCLLALKQHNHVQSGILPGAPPALPCWILVFDTRT